MAHNGGGSKATAAQRVEVLRLREAGWSIRRIAADVFGHERFRGRVERLLQSPQGPPAVSREQLEAVDLTDTTALLRELYNRRVAAWIASGETPSMNELRNLCEVQRRLLAMEQFDRMTSGHRRSRHDRLADMSGDE